MSPLVRGAAGALPLGIALQSMLPPVPEGLGPRLASWPMGVADTSFGRGWLVALDEVDGDSVGTATLQAATENAISIVAAQLTKPCL